MKKTHTTLDVERTGQRINKAIRDSGYKVADIQKALNFECPQSIYRWMRGTALPSIDSLFILCKLLGIAMEDILVAREANQEKVQEDIKKSIWDF